MTIFTARGALEIPNLELPTCDLPTRCQRLQDYEAGARAAIRALAAMGPRQREEELMREGRPDD